MKYPPSAIGLVLCEQVVIEERTHNVTPVNCFNFRAMDVFPGQIAFCVLAWLADGRGEMMTELAVERLATQEEVFRENRNLKFAGPLHDSRFLARIRNCEIPTPGYYQVSLVIDHELIAHRKFRVFKMGSGK